MITIKIKDNNEQQGFKISKSFNVKYITDEVVDYIKKTPNIYSISSINEVYKNKDIQN